MLKGATPAKFFDLDLTMSSGQIFGVQKIGGWWYVFTANRVFRAAHAEEKLVFENISEPEVRRFFGLDDDLPKIYSLIARDDYMLRTVKHLRGLRIVRQEPWPCLLSFLCATNMTVEGIARMLRNLSQKFGENATCWNRTFRLLPTAKRLASLSLGDLSECGLGYRARFISETSKDIAAGFDLTSLRKLPYNAATERLLNLSGVGRKVADCVLLFSCGFQEAFPADVWIKRLVLEHYSNLLDPELVKRLESRRGLSPAEYRRLGEFGRRYFGEYAGYAQEYLYMSRQI